MHFGTRLSIVNRQKANASSHGCRGRQRKAGFSGRASDDTADVRARGGSSRNSGSGGGGGTAPPGSANAAGELRPFWGSIVTAKEPEVHRGAPADAGRGDAAEARGKWDAPKPERATNGGAAGRGGAAGVEYLFHVDGGGEIKARVAEEGGAYRVTLNAGATDVPLAGRPCFVHWGIFRRDRTTWLQVAPSAAPAGTIFLGGDIAAMRTPLEPTGPSGAAEVAFRFPAADAPLSLNFVLYAPPAGGAEERWVQSKSGTNFSVPVGMRKGAPQPLGAAPDGAGGANFALFSRSADGVTLCLYSPGAADPTLEIDLDPAMHRTGDVWHLKMDSIAKFDRYGYRCRGELSWDSGARFHSRQVLLDPYAAIVATPVPGQEDWPSPAAALGLLTGREAPFEWDGDFPPRIPAEELVAYRMCVPDFTSDASSGLPAGARGTFLGVAEKAAHLSSLGVNAVILQPVAAYDETQGPYYPISLFAPMAAYGPGHDPLEARRSLKEMVKELHGRGIEVILEVVYSHTAEQNDEDPKAISFRGIDAATYYIQDMFGQPITPDFGAGNQFNCNNPPVQALVLDSLRHWVREYHVDGFCFVNAPALLTGPHGQALSRPPLVELLAFDPLLAGAKLIADAVSPVTDVVPQAVAFPHWGRWAEVNGAFRSSLRGFVRGEAGQLSNLATILCGSADVFAKGRGPCHSLNFVTSSHGFTLADLVSYTNDIERSWNCGEEGPSDNIYVNNSRRRQMCNFLAALFFSQGVPLLCMGDEYGHSRNGEIFPSEGANAFRWDALEEGFGRNLVRFVSCLGNFRARRRLLLQRTSFLEPEDLTWHGAAPHEPLWDVPESSFLAVVVHAAEVEALLPPAALAGGDSDAGDLYLAFNAHSTAVGVTLPEPGEGTTWYRIIDTSLASPSEFDLAGTEILPPGLNFGAPCEYTLESFSALLLEARVTRGPDGEPLAAVVKKSRKKQRAEEAAAAAAAAAEVEAEAAAAAAARAASFPPTAGPVAPAPGGPSGGSFGGWRGP